jgi:hypothetical protein
MTHLFKQLETTIDNRISTFETKIENRISTFETKIENRISIFETKIENRISTIESKFDRRFELLSQKVDNLFERGAASSIITHFKVDHFLDVPLLPANRIFRSSVSSHMYKAIGQAVSRIVCDRTKKKMPFMGLEPHTCCYPGRCPSQLD